MYFEINSLVIVFMFAAFVLHEATALWDVAYALKRREVTLFEQHVHSYLAVIPFMIGSLAICLHADQFWALFGLGESPADFSLRLKQPPLSSWVHVALGSGVVRFLALPYMEEFWRCLRFPRVPSERPA